MSTFLLIAGAVLVAFEVVLAVLFPSPLTIGLLVFVALMFVINFSAWRSTR